MYFVGIDISKYKHDCFITNEADEVIRDTFSFDNTTDELLITSILGLYDKLNEEINFLQSEIESIMIQLDFPTESIPGIGIISVATIISEFDDISRFSNADKLVTFAGLDCGRDQSGTQDFKGKMVKHGSGYQRYALINVAETVMMHNPSFYEYYHKKRTEGKAHRVALSHVARKLVRLIYRLETNNIRFDLSSCR